MASAAAPIGLRFMLERTPADFAPEVFAGESTRRQVVFIHEPQTAEELAVQSLVPQGVSIPLGARNDSAAGRRRGTCADHRRNRTGKEFSARAKVFENEMFGHASSPPPTRTWRPVCAKGSFRADLCYLLKVLYLLLPPLRERPLDIAVLSRHFLEMIRVSGEGTHQLSLSALRKLRSYSWPGNVRELHNVVHSPVRRRASASAESVWPVPLRW